MFNCNYTSNTTCTFDTNLCDMSENINYIGITPECELENALICKPTSNKWVQLFVPKIMDIPVQKPDIEGIISVNSCIDIISKRIVKTPTISSYTNSKGEIVTGESIANAECTHLTGRKLIIEGIISQKVIYTALVAEQSLHSASFTIPFSVFIIVDKDTHLSQKFQVYAYLEDVFTCMLSNRSIFSNNTIFIKAIPIC